MIFAKTYQPKAKEIKRHWHFVDARGKILGRLASQIANLLIGKNKPNYVPHLDFGDYVVITNAEKIEVTGKKEKQKLYRWHSGYPGGLKEKTLDKLRKENPTQIIRMAVEGMLPKNRLRTQRMKRLKIFSGPKHPYLDKIQTDSSQTKIKKDDQKE